MKGNGHRRDAGFYKRTYRLSRLARDLAYLGVRYAQMDAVWRRKRVDPGLRELVMLAVARLNEARWCNFVHNRWARYAGVDARRLEAVEARDQSAFDRRSWLAMEWARARSASHFATTPPRLEREARQVLSPQELSDLELVARAMTLSNLSSNTLDALLSRLRGAPALDGRLLDEVLISAAVLATFPALGILLLVFERRAPHVLVREFRRSAEALERAHGAA